MTNLIPEKEITFKSYDGAMKVIDALLDEGYVVMLSREENLFIVNYIWSSEDYPSRNDVVFMSRDEFEDEFWESIREKAEDDEEGETRTELEMRVRRDAEETAWHFAQMMLDMSASDIEEAFDFDKLTEVEQEIFWENYPHNIPYGTAVVKLEEWKKKKEEALSEQVLNEAMTAWDTMRYNQYMKAVEKEENNDGQ